MYICTSGMVNPTCRDPGGAREETLFGGEGRTPQWHWSAPRAAAGNTLYIEQMFACATTCPSTATCHHRTHLVPQRLGQVLPRPIHPYLPDVGVPPVLVVGQHGQLQQVGLEVRAAEQWVEWLWEGVGKRRAQRHGPGLTCQHAGGAALRSCLLQLVACTGAAEGQLT